MRLENAKEYLTFDDVMFQPNYFEGDSRSQISIASEFAGLKMELPVFSANMKHVTGENMALELARHGGIGILHRFKSIVDAEEEFCGIRKILEKTENCDETHKVGVSVGVNKEDRERFLRLQDKGARLFCIDIAHGHCRKMKEMLQFMKENKKDATIIIAGNIASVEAARDLVEWGASIVKCGIGPGAMCQTRENTGAGVPQLSILEEIHYAFEECGIRSDVGIIADGGMKTTGHIAKSLVYADAVMLGTMLAGTSETPGHVFENKDGQYYKVMAGSASAEEKTANGNEKKFVEGMTTTIPFRGHVKYIFRKIHENLQSSFSYSGASNMEEFKQKARFIILSYGGMKESKI